MKYDVNYIFIAYFLSKMYTGVEQTFFLSQLTRSTLFLACWYSGSQALEYVAFTFQYTVWYAFYFPVYTT